MSTTIEPALLRLSEVQRTRVGLKQNRDLFNRIECGMCSLNPVKLV